MPTFGYTPTPTPLTQDELDLLAAEQQAMGGYVPAGGYVAEPVPPPSAGPQAVPPPGAVPSPGLGSGSAYTASPPEAVPPPPSSAVPTWDFLTPLSQVRDAAVASPVGQAVGGIMSTPLPFADRVDVPPPTAVGGYLAQGNPGAAAQVVGDVAGRDPLTTALTLATLPLGGGVLGTVGRGLLGAGRAAGVARTAAPIARPAAQTIDQYRRIKKLEQMSPLRRLAEEHGGMIGLGVPAAAVGAILKDFDPSAPTTGTNTPSETESAARYRTGGSPPATPATTRPAGTNGAAGRPASSVPASAPVNATTQTTPAAPVSAPTRSSPPPQTGSADTDDDLLATLGLLDDPIDVASAEPFTASDFTGQLADLPGLRSVAPDLAAQMARLANSRMRKRRGKRPGPFSMEAAEFHRVVRESVFAALREGGVRR